MAIKSKDSNFVKCINCRHAKFMQWFENPIIAYCKLFHQRQVAEAKRNCRDFVPSNIKDPEITHYDSYDTPVKLE